MTRFTLHILILLLIITIACTGRKSRVDHRNLIPEKELVPVLTDIYLADGLLFVPKVKSWFSDTDSLATYNYIIEKHGYTKEVLDRTMKYYFVKRPKKLVAIYDQVLGILSEMESLIDKEGALEEEESTIDYWTDHKFYSFPDPTASDSTLFDITLTKPGIYSLVYTAALFPGDQTYNPRLTIYSCHPDSIETGVRKYYNTLSYIKDGYPHDYYLIIKVPVRKPFHLRGCLYSFDNHPDEWGKHIVINNLSLNSSFISK